METCTAVPKPGRIKSPSHRGCSKKQKLQHPTGNTVPESSLIPLTLSASRWWFFQKSQSQSGTTGRCSSEQRCTCRRSAAVSDPLLWPCSPWLCRTRLCRTQTAGSNHADGHTLEEKRHGVSNSQETLRERVHCESETECSQDKITYVLVYSII